MIDILSDFLIKSHDSGIYTIGRYIARHVAAHWEQVFDESAARAAKWCRMMSDAFFAEYCELLFEPLNQELRRAGFVPQPDLPGNFARSRERGPEHERQRWLWSKIISPRNDPLGSILVIFYHDHTRLRISRPPLVLPLEETAMDGMQATVDTGNELMLLQS